MESLYVLLPTVLTTLLYFFLQMPDDLYMVLLFQYNIKNVNNHTFGSIHLILKEN